ANGQGEKGRRGEADPLGTVQLQHEARGHPPAPFAEARLALQVGVDMASSVGAAREKAGRQARPPVRDDVEEIELSLLLEGVYRQYGFDFREYAPASLRRRVWRRIHAEGLTTLSALQDALPPQPAGIDRLLLAL